MIPPQLWVDANGRPKMPFNKGRGKKRTRSCSPGFSMIESMFNSAISDPLVHHGRHFGRTIHAFCQVYTLITNGLIREMDILEPNEALFPLSLE